MKEKMVTFESHINGLKDQGKNITKQSNGLQLLATKEQRVLDKSWCKRTNYLCEVTGD